MGRLKFAELEVGFQITPLIEAVRSATTIVCSENVTGNAEVDKAAAKFLTNFYREVGKVFDDPADPTK